MISILSGDELLWSEFEAGLDVLVEATRAADRSYVEGRGMSLASIAVGSAATRLSKVMNLGQKCRMSDDVDAAAHCSSLKCGTWCRMLEHGTRCVRRIPFFFFFILRRMGKN